MIRRLRALIIAVAVVVVLLVIADRISLRVAQDEVRDQVLRHASWTGGTTAVHIGGFPFLTQVMRGDYQDVEVRAEDVTIDEVPDVTVQVTLNGVHLSLSDLRSRDLNDVPVDRISGYAQVTYDAVADRIADAGRGGIIDVGLGRSGSELELAVSLDLLGQRVIAVAAGTLAVWNGALRITATSIDVDGSVPTELADPALAALNAVLTDVAVLPTLPYGLKLTAVSLTPDGIRADAVATDVRV